MKTDFKVGIVGTGFAGLVAALQLKKRGNHSFVMFERAAEVGGTWRDNTYPGCACDVASHLYSFAGEPNPHWSREYSTQPEILAYLKDTVARHELQKHIRFDSDIIEARFLEDSGCWQVTDRKGRSTLVQVLILGMGPLNRAIMPRFPGMETFKGHIFHSSQWDVDYELKGKRVAVIGTGASAIQIVPNIAPVVSRLLVVQRTPAWVSFRLDKKIGPARQWLYRRFPKLMKLKRDRIFWMNEFFGLGFIGHKRLNKIMHWLALRKLAKEVKDPAVRKKLTPDYTIGCKRVLRSDDYYPAFNRPNVALLTEAIASFTETGIVTADGREHPLDAVIFATGFVAADIEFYTRVIGREGRNLVEEWKEKGAEAYLGTTVSGYPNLGLLLGPNTGLGHNSVVLMMEAQMQYLLQYIEQLSAAPTGSFLDVKAEVQEAYNERIQQQLRGTVWASGCKSWYMNRRGKNTTLYPRLVHDFQKETSRFDPQSYRLEQPAVARRGKDSVNL